MKMKMNDVLNKVQHLATPTMKGLAAQFLPEVVKGLLVEYLGKVSLQEIVKYIEEDAELWEQIPPQTQEKTKSFLNNLTKGHIDWFTTTWMINAISDDLPAVASLFLGWEEAQEWLDRQIVNIKEKIKT